MTMIQFAAAAADAQTMTPAGWAIMFVSVGSVLSLVGFCLYRVLTLPANVAEERLQGPLTIDTGDTENAD
jgi:hypothetical protein